MCYIGACPKKTEHVAPGEVLLSLEDLGSALSLARRVRGDTQSTAGERCGFHAQTVARIESGDPSVSIGKVFSLLSNYGMVQRLFDLSLLDDSTQVLLKRMASKRGKNKQVKKP